MRLFQGEVQPAGAVRLDVAVLSGNAGSVQPQRLEPVSYTHLDVYKRQTLSYGYKSKPLSGGGPLFPGTIDLNGAPLQQLASDPVSYTHLDVYKRQE